MITRSFPMNDKLITIITVVYNSVDLIEDTVKSVISHDLSNFEYVVVDGGSTDGTVEIINKYLDKISVFVSEPDKGIYDAMNKGISLSSGKFVGFINCGDKLLDLPLKEISNNSDSLINCFPVLLSSGDIMFPHNGPLLKVKNTLPHQGCFYKKSDSLIYDTKYKIFSDFNLNQKAYKNKQQISVFESPVVAFHDEGGVSHDKRNSKEIFEVVKSNYGRHFQILSWLYFKKQGALQRIKKLFN
jgi:glycosyltransferase involved in cell wall biosynthesis